MPLIQRRLYPRSVYDMNTRYHQYPLDMSLLEPFDDLMNDSMPLFGLAPKFQLRAAPKHRIKIDCNGFDPKVVKTELTEDKAKLIVSAKVGDEKPDEEGDFAVKKFRRTYKLPENVDVDRMLRYVTRHGQIFVEFPLKIFDRKRKVDYDENTPADVTVASDEQKRVKLSFDLPEDLDPAKVKVTCHDRDLIVQAENKAENSQCYYYRRSTLPSNVDLDALKCVLEDNKLRIEAPCHAKADKSNVRTIPVENMPIQTSSEH